MRGLLRWALVVVAGCGPAGREIVEPSEIAAAGGAPALSDVIDLGDLAELPARGPLSLADRDDVFVVGELVLIEGAQFGKLPTVEIGGLPVHALARTAAGGIVCRIPPEVPAGRITVAVANPGGRGQLEIAVRRYAVAALPGQGTVFVVDGATREGPRKLAELAVPGVRDLAISADGQVAYAAASRGADGTVDVIALTAGGGPKRLPRGSLGLPGASRVAVAAHARIAVVAARAELAVLDLGEPRTPVVVATVPWTGALRGLVLAPDGRRAYVIGGDDNALRVVDLADAGRPVVGPPLALLPAERVPILRDLGLSPDGGELWVLCGDGAETAAAGLHPAELVVVALAGTPTVSRTVAIAAAGPGHLAISRHEVIGAATAIRSTRRRATVVVSSADPGFLAAGAERWRAPSSAELLVADLDGAAHRLTADPGLYGGVVLDSAGELALATTVGPAGAGRLQLSLTVVPIDGRPKTFVPLATVAASQVSDSGGVVAIVP